MSKGQPLEGDHSAFDDYTYPSVHSKAVKDGTPRIHVPWPATAGQVPISDGSKYVLTTLTAMTIGSMEGALEVSTSPLRIYNQYGFERTITKVFIAVNTAPTGSSIIVDILNGGVSIFAAQEDMPEIAASEYVGYSTDIDNASWDVDEYLQMEVEQIGSSVAGSDLTVHIVSIPA